MLGNLRKIFGSQWIILSILIEAIMLIILLSNGVRIINNAISNQTDLRLQASSPLLNAAIGVTLFERDYSTLIEILEVLHNNNSHNFEYIVVFDESKEIYAQVGKKETFTFDTTFKKESKGIVHANRPITLSGETIGHVFYGLSIQSFLNSKSLLITQNIIIASIEIVLSIILLFFTARFLTRNVDTLLKQLVDTEKMTSLGSLVAGVAHEVNTPIGVSLTGISHIKYETNIIIKALEENTLAKSHLIEHLNTVKDLSQSLETSLSNAAKLVRSFKQVAVDQHTEEKRDFNLNDYCENILLGFSSQLKQKNVTLTSHMDTTIELHTYPGIFSQILSNLLVNSLLHAFDTQGNISIEAHIKNKTLHIVYSDDGKGMSDDVLKKVFDPFFSTKMGQGGSGLGMHIIYNLVTQKLHGEIRCESKPDKGMHVFIDIPMQELTL